MSDINIGIVDTGISNEINVSKAIESLGAKVIIVKNISDFDKVDGLVIPGVGVFGAVIKNLKKNNFIKMIKKFIKKKPIFGICAGLQIFFKDSEESKGIKGLGYFNYRVRKVNFSRNKSIIGWNKVRVKKNKLFFKNRSNNFYFCHSFYPNISDEKIIIGSSNIANFNYPVAVSYKNFYGVQFHPEKSGSEGIKIFKNFINICKLKKKK